MIFRLASLSLFVSICATVAQAQSALQGGGWSVRGTDPIQIYYQDQHITNYESGAKEGRPYFYPLNGADGEALFSETDQEKDGESRPHQRGIWFGLSDVNGVNFWHPAPEEGQTNNLYGKIEHRGLKGVTISSKDLTFKTASDWIEQESNRRLLSDRREFRFFFDTKGALVIDLHLTLVADGGDVVINGAQGGAWAVRAFPSTKVEETKESPNWIQWQGENAAEKPIDLALINHPSNPKQPTAWFARPYGLVAANPFGGFEFDPEIPAGPSNFLLENGEEATFQFRLILSTDPLSEEVIQTHFESFSKR